MMTKKKAKTTSVSSAKTSPPSAVPSHASKTLIDIDGLSVSYGSEPVLQDVSFCVHSGEFIGIIGPNGAGKTTLLETILGLQRATSGTIARGKKVIGYVPQRSSLGHRQIPMSVLEVVRLGSRGNVQKAQTALAAVDMPMFAQAAITELSGGQQQRVLIAKALAADPEILILDEPTTGIDEQSQAEFYKILDKLHARGITICMVSHDVDTVLHLVSRVICLNRTVVYDGPAAHFEADQYLPKLYGQHHRLLHHRHEGNDHA